MVIYDGWVWFGVVLFDMIDICLCGLFIGLGFFEVNFWIYVEFVDGGFCGVYFFIFDVVDCFGVMMV